MEYQDTWLWQRAFVQPRTDATKSEQQYFQERYFSMREKAVALVGRIQTDMPNMTVHDASHLDSLWEMGSILARDRVDLNPPEAFVYGGAILLHDAAMTVAAYPNGLEGLKETLAWKDSYARIAMNAQDALGESPNDKLIEDLATAEALRIMHAPQAEKLPSMSWKSSSGGDELLIDDTEVRNFYGPKIGQLAHSHWWPISRVEDDLANDLGPLGGRTGNRIDLTKIACLLRTSDAMHIDRRRAPAFLRKLLNPRGISEQHWAFQERMAVPFIDEEALVYTAAPPFELSVADAWWLAYDTLLLIDKELRGVDHLLQKRSTGRLNANRVRGIDGPSELAKLVETAGWVPVDSTVRVSDVPKIVSTLGGRKLYGDQPSAALRELIQNASDAVSVRRKLQKRSQTWGQVTISLERRGAETWLVVEDNGVGMSPNVLTGPLIDFGNSFWRSPLAAQEFPGIQASGLSVRGKFGIGFFSIFMLGKRVTVTSRRYDKASDSARTLEFQHGLGSRPVLYETNPSDYPMDGGTRVSVCLDKEPTLPAGLLHPDRYGSATPLLYLAASIAPNLDVELVVKEGASEESVVRPKDWLTLGESQFFARLSALALNEKDSKGDDHSRLRILSRDGQIYGRAMIETARSGSGARGCITVGGLRARNIGYICGVLAGREVTAARNDALALVPPDVLSDWATQQANLITQARISDDGKARGAQTVLTCGGAIGDLPIARLNGDWLSTSDLIELLSSREQLDVYFGEVEYDSDSDEVHPKEFENSFEEDPLVLFVPTDYAGYSRMSISGYFSEVRQIEAPSNLEDLVRSLIGQAWDPWRSDEDVSVGSVNGSEIIRGVVRYEKDTDGAT
ncbi:HD domain-containing protein [Bradyrhizobium ganzhouense]|uniref:HD domain-containing protein n=1 Tax=Bradyrhizobium ganzhouense TaxID=1179767 RepID=UPI003CE82E9E